MTKACYIPQHDTTSFLSSTQTQTQPQPDPPTSGTEFRLEDHQDHGNYPWVEDILKLGYREMNYSQAVDLYNPKVGHSERSPREDNQPRPRSQS